MMLTGLISRASGPCGPVDDAPPSIQAAPAEPTPELGLGSQGASGSVFSSGNVSVRGCVVTWTYPKRIRTEIRVDGLRRGLGGREPLCCRLSRTDLGQSPAPVPLLLCGLG